MKHLFLASALMLGACASPENQAALRSFQHACGAGDVNACYQADYQAEANDSEAQANGQIVAAAILIPLAIVAALAGRGHGGYGGDRHSARFHR